MKRILYLAAILAVLTSCDGKKPEPGPGPEPEYKNSFTLLGEWEGPWNSSRKLAVVETAGGSSVGTASFTGGESVSKGTWELKTNAEPGTAVRVLNPEGATLGVNTLPASQKGAGAAGADADCSYAWSGEKVLDASWPVEFSLTSPMVYLKILVSAPKGTPLYRTVLKSLGLQCSGVALSGDFSTDFGSGKISPLPSASDRVTVELAEPAMISEESVEVWAVVFPADLKDKNLTISATVSSSSGTETYAGILKGRKLEGGNVYTVQAGGLGSALVPGDKSRPEYSSVSIDYKVQGTDNTYQKGSQTTVDGMNWMAKYTTNPCDRWGGLPDVKPDQICSANPSGFWRTGKKNGRHVMVDPDGNIAIIHGMNGVAPEILKEATSTLGQKEFKARFGNDFNLWSQWANGVLSDCHFNFYSTNMNRVVRYKDFITPEIENTLHNYTDDSRISQVEIALLLRTFSWDYYSASHSQRGYNNSEVGIAALMFDPYYLSYIDGVAQEAAAISKGKQDFLGWYLDNELQFRWSGDSKPGIWLREWLVLEEGPDHCQANGYAKKFAQDFMRDKYGVEPVVSNITPAMENDFLYEVARYYYRTASEAIRRYDSDHLIIGSRLHGLPRQRPEIVKACAEYCDIVSINIYSMWVPEDSYFINDYTAWVREWDKPFLVSEFYTRDATLTYEGKPYSRTGEGGGWYVKGQEDRGRVYQGFTRKLLSYSNCIGWEWFQMTDDYADSYNGWNNKGIVSPKYEPYTDCVKYMRQLHDNIYQIVDYYAPGIVPQGGGESAPAAYFE